MINFLGGVRFAALLITCAAALVIYATYIESKYACHEAAVEIVYQSALFNALLIGFFINIFLSTLRRYPFKKKHIPFIITHIGLLMVIGGTFIKNRWGIQGTMELVEGSSTQQIRLSGSKALHINGTSYPLQETIHHEGVEIQMGGIIPHATLTYTGIHPERPFGYKIESCQDITAPPALVLECSKGDLKDKIALSFNDPFPWPLFNEYALSFQPHLIDIPHRLRLHQARKICYPGLNQAASYEADISTQGTLFTLKMNQVFETEDHYRFYLASMTDPIGDAKQIVIVVNYDPVRSSLTYPGALLVVIGASLLFFRKK